MSLTVSPPARLLRGAVAFQSDLEAIMAEAPPRLLRLTTYVILVLLGTLLLVAGLLHVDILVQASGHLAADTPTIVLQPLERSIIRSLAVKAGDSVSRGQILATLDPTFSEADLGLLATQQRSLAAAIARAEAELEGAPLPMAGGPEAALQATLFAARLQQYAAKLRGLDEEIGRDETALRNSVAEAELLTRQLAVARSVESMRATLLASQTGSRLQYLEAEASSMRAERDYQVAVGRQGELQHSAEGKRAERLAFVNHWRSDLLEELATHRAEAARVAESLAKAMRLHELVALTAPADGVVLEVAKRSTGSVLREAEPLFTLLPSDAALIADVMVASAEVGYLRPGDAVTVKVDAFPYQRHGALHGHVRSIGQQSGSGEEAGAPRGAFHRVQVVLDRTALTGLPPDARLIPGMTVSAELVVGARSVLSYFLDPITSGLDTSFREP